MKESKGGSYASLYYKAITHDDSWLSAVSHFLCFLIMDLAPGDAVDLMAPEGATTEELAEIRHDLGLDKPVVLRYADYMIGSSMVIWAFLMCQRPMCFPHM